MNRQGPIIFIEDDSDDQLLIRDAFTELQLDNDLLFFSEGTIALDYLIQTKVKPFIIFSDINMPRLGGMELRSKVHENEDLRLKSIPYILFSTLAEQQNVVDAYSKSIQGFFIKPSKYSDLKDILKTIIEYWQKCESPNYVS